MKKILLFICMVMFAVGAKASDNLYFVNNPTSTTPEPTATYKLTTTPKAITLFFAYKSSADMSSGTVIKVTKAVDVNGKTISSGYSLSAVTHATTRSNTSYSQSTLTVNEAGTYTIYVYHQASSSYMNDTKTITVTDDLKTNTLVYNDKSVTPRVSGTVINLANCFSSSNSNGAITYSMTANEGATLNSTNGTLTINKPGSYTITATQAKTSSYKEATTTFTVTASASKLNKVHSCMINDYQMSEWYSDGADNTWKNNTPNLRYVNHNSVITAEEYLAKGLDTDAANHTVLKFTDNRTDLITSNRMLVNSNNEILSTNLTFNDADKFDYVVPGNATPITKGEVASGAKARRKAARKAGTSAEPEQMVNFVRVDGIPAQGHYATICLPFDVPADYMPKTTDFTFEEHTDINNNYTNASGLKVLKFTQATELRAGKPYIFKRVGSNTTLEFHVPADKTTFVSQPDVTSDPYFFGTFVNLVTKDLHCETAQNPYNNGNSNVSYTELDNYFEKLKEATRVAYFLKPSGSTDLIKKATTNVSSRPFRAFFRLNESDFESSGSAKQSDFLFVDHGDDDFGVTEVKQINYESLQLDVYDIHGRKVASDVDEEDPTDGLQPGIYVLSNGKKVLKK